MIVNQKSYIVVDTLTGKANIIKAGTCQGIDFEAQANQREFVIDGRINQKTQKIVDGKIVNKTTSEMDAEKSPPLNPNEMPANILQKDWNALQDRLTELEKKVMT